MKLETLWLYTCGTIYSLWYYRREVIGTLGAGVALVALLNWITMLPWEYPTYGAYMVQQGYYVLALIAGIGVAAAAFGGDGE